MDGSPRSTTGSSPRLRGTVIIPSLALMPVHPRACGETDDCPNNPGVGSSPRLRGTELTMETARCQIPFGSSPRLRGTEPSPGMRPSRFIPAPAGNGSVMTVAQIAVTGSSPRLRGTGWGKAGRTCNGGSSPRLRGTDTMIPGKATSVHPRACGERLSTRSESVIRFIPAPAGNGQTTRSWLHNDGRFIPAPAGNGSSTLADTGTGRFIPAPAGNG